MNLRDSSHYEMQLNSTLSLQAVVWFCRSTSMGGGSLPQVSFLLTTGMGYINHFCLKHLNDVLLAPVRPDPSYQILGLRMVQLCRNRKLVTFSKTLSYEEMKTTRNFLCDNTVGETVQSQKFIDYLCQHASFRKTSFVVAGKPVCKPCWRLVCRLWYNKLTGLIQKMQ